MLKQIKAYLIILYILWPFSAVIYGIRKFESQLGRNLLIAAFAFLGYTVVEIGDLERYASDYYQKSNFTLEQVMYSLSSLRTGKFFNEFLSVIFSFFENHHLFFSILYLIFGYFLIQTIFCFFIKPFKTCSTFEKFLLIAFSLYFSIRASINLAFYTGAIYYLYMLANYLINGRNRRYLWLTFLTPLFHIGLAPLLLATLLLLIFRKKTYLYFIPFVLSLIISQTSIIDYVGGLLSNYDNQMLEGKYRSYVAEEGQKALNKRYSEGLKDSNLKLVILNKSREVLQYVILPFAMVLIWLKRKTFFQNETVLILFNAILATWTVSNLMMNISLGDRFLQVHTFLCFGLLVIVTQLFSLKRYFFNYLRILIFFALFYGIGSLYASFQLLSLKFFVSNFIIESINIFEL